MRKIILCLIFFPIYLQGDAQVKKYRAKISAMLDDYDGNIHINLFGENKGLVRIDVKRILKEDSSFGVSKTFGVPDKKNSTFNLDAGFVYKVIINKDTFYRKDLLETYEKTDGSNRKKNCFVKRIYGKEDIHLYEWTNANKEIQYYIQFQLSDNNAAKNINHPNYDKWSADMILYGFKKCKKMKDRFMDDFKNPTKYPFYNLKTLDEKLTAWKKLIDEYDACDLKSGK